MKPSKIENQQIWEHELNRRLKRLEGEQQATVEMEKHRLKELHWMHCPKCGQELATERHGSVELTCVQVVGGCGWTLMNWKPSWRARAVSFARV